MVPGLGSGREVNVPKLHSTLQSTVVLIEITIWDALLIWLNGGVSSKVDCVVIADLAHLLPDPTTSERKYLSSETDYGHKRGSIVKQKEHALQWYAIQYTSFPNNSRNIRFLKYSKLFVLTLRRSREKKNFVLVLQVHCMKNTD